MFRSFIIGALWPLFPWLPKTSLPALTRQQWTMTTEVSVLQSVRDKLDEYTDRHGSKWSWRNWEVIWNVLVFYIFLVKQHSYSCSCRYVWGCTRGIYSGQSIWGCATWPRPCASRGPSAPSGAPRRRARPRPRSTTPPPARCRRRSPRTPDDVQKVNIHKVRS